MPDIKFDRYYRYEELTRLLLAYVAEYPENDEALQQCLKGFDTALMK